MNKTFVAFLLAGISFLNFSCSREPSLKDKLKLAASSKDFWQDIGSCQSSDIELEQLHHEFSSLLANDSVHVVVSDITDKDTRNGQEGVDLSQATKFTADLVKNGQPVAHLFYTNNIFHAKGHDQGIALEERSFSLIDVHNENSLTGVTRSDHYIVDNINGRALDASQCQLH